MIQRCKRNYFMNSHDGMRKLDANRMDICLVCFLSDVSEQNGRRPEIIESLRNSEMFPEVIQICKGILFINFHDGMRKLDVDRMHIC